MARIAVTVLMYFLWHFPTTFFVPAGAPYESGWLLWPFGRQSKPVVDALQGLFAPAQLPSTGATPTVALVAAGIASLAVILAAGSLWGIVVPADWWRPLMVVAAVSSAVLFLIYLGPWAIVPLIVDAAALWLVLVQGASVASLTSS